MKRTRYAISWLYGEFRIALFRRGEMAAQWESPSLVESQNDLVRALDTAAQHFDLSIRGDVTIVHEHDLHTHDYLEVPAMQVRDLEKYLQRRVEKDKSFAEDADWCYHKVSHRGGKQGVLLHLLPKRIVASTTAACAAVGLAPKRYVPLTEIVSGYLATRSISADSLVAIVASFKTRTEIIIALGSGEALLVRELNYGLVGDTVARLESDVNRTLRYARQQLNRTVDMALMMGQFDAAVAAQVESGIDVPVHFDADAGDPYFWARQAVDLSGKLSANFISVLAQKNITGDLIRRVSAWSTAAVVVLTVVLMLFTEGLVAHRAEQMRKIETRSDDVRELIDQVVQRLSSGRMKQDHLGRLRASSKTLPSLVLVHLSRLTPQEVTLTNVAIHRTEPGWRVSLQGRVAGDMRQSARILARFEERLRSPPWRLSLSESFTSAWMEQFEQGKLKQSGQLGFRITGDLR